MSTNRKVLQNVKSGIRIVLGLAFIVASTFHFTASEVQTKIIPPFLPWRRAAVYITGVLELLGGYGLLLPRFKRQASWGLAALLVAIVPANIYHAVVYFKKGGPPNMRVYHWVRMPIQVILIVLTLWSGSLEHNSKW
jgi:uncharacterized membrane protein